MGVKISPNDNIGVVSRDKLKKSVLCPMTIKMPYGEESLPGLEACYPLFVPGVVFCKHVSCIQIYISVLRVVTSIHGGQARLDVVL